MDEAFKNETGLDPANQSLAEALNLSFKILKGIMILLVVLFLSSGVFTVANNEVAMILRFGKIQGTRANRVLKSGLHWTWPYPLSKVIKIPYDHQHILNIDDFWYYKRANENRKRKNYPKTLDPTLDGYYITSDANVVHSKWQVRYKIADPYLYYTRLKDPEKTIKSVVSSCIVRVNSSFKVHDALRKKVDDIRLKVQSQAQEKLDEIESGVEIQGLAIPNLVPPRQVQDAFESVIKAKSQQDKKIEQANNYKSQLLNKALGEKTEILAKAINYKLQIEKEAESDAHYFKKILVLYQKYPDIFMKRHYLQTMKNVMKKGQEFFWVNDFVKELRIKINRNPDLYGKKAPTED